MIDSYNPYHSPDNRAVPSPEAAQRTKHNKLSFLFAPLQSNPHSVPNLDHPWPGFHFYKFCHFQMSHKLNYIVWNLWDWLFPLRQCLWDSSICVCMLSYSQVVFHLIGILQFVYPVNVERHLHSLQFLVIMNRAADTFISPHLYPTSNVWEFQLLHILVSTWYCQFLIWPILMVCVFTFNYLISVSWVL